MEAIITTDGKRIIAQIPYANGAGKDWAKKVPGARAIWDKTVTPNRFLGWGYPLTIDTCRTFRRVFGKSLIVSNVLAQWATAEIARENQLEDARSGETALDLDLVRKLAPQLYLAMESRKYQMAGAAFLQLGRKVLLGDQPGLGKTLQTLAALVQSFSLDILVACPRTATRSVWLRETNRWTPEIEVFVAQGSHQEREAQMNAFTAFQRSFPDVPRMLVINTEMLRVVPERCPENLRLRDCKIGHTDWHPHERNIEDWPWLFRQSWDAIILDESHNLLASTRNVQSKQITQGRYGAMRLRRQLRPNGLALALSGTPFRSKLEKSWGTLNWLRPDVFSSFWRFAETHFGVIDDGWGKKIGVEDEHGKRVAIPLEEAAFQAAMRPYYLARTKTEAAPDLPPIQYAGTPPASNPEGLPGIWLDMASEQSKAYQAIKANGMAQLKGGMLYATGVLAEITRMRQLACSSLQLAGQNVEPSLPSNKMEWLLEFLHEREGHRGKVVVASSFTKLVQLAARAINVEFGSGYAMTLTGATSDRDREGFVRFFNDPNHRSRVGVINRDAGGVAITLDIADDMVILDPPWLSDQDEQLESRIHRVSRIHNVTIYRLFSTGTVDEWIANLTAEQREALRTAQPKDIKELILEALG